MMIKLPILCALKHQKPSLVHRTKVCVTVCLQQQV